MSPNQITFGIGIIIDFLSCTDPFFLDVHKVFGPSIKGILFPAVPFVEPMKFEWALQGTMLIYDGNILKSIKNKEKKNYSAISFRQDGSIEIFISKNKPSTLKDFVTDIRAYRPDCKNLMLLDTKSEYAYLMPSTKDQERAGKVERFGLNENSIKIHFAEHAQSVWHL